MPTSDGQLTVAELAQIAALVQAQAKLRAGLTATAVAAATAPLLAISGLGSWFSSSASQKYINSVLAVVRPAMTRMARTTDAYQAQVLSVMTGRRVQPVGAVDVSKLRRAITSEQATQIVAALPAGYDFAGSQPATAVTSAPATAVAAPASPLRTGSATAAAPAGTSASPATVPMEQVYGRIFDNARYNIVARGLAAEQVAKAAAARAAHVAATDVTLAGRAQSRATMRARGVQQYRRVIRPYAGKGGPVCGLCIVASDRLYYVEDLLPIHDNCRCEVVPVGAVNDPGKTLNDDDLRGLYRAAGGTGAGQLIKVQVAVSEHGELGPVLSYANHKRRGVTEVAAASGADRTATRKAQLASYEKSIVALRDRAAAGDAAVQKALEFQADKIDQLRRELAGAA